MKSNFTISDEDYKAFEKFLEDKEYDYDSESADLIEELEELAKKEEAYEAVKTEFEGLRKILIRDKSQDLLIHKEEISEFINQEIVSRYLYQKGRIQSTLLVDNEIEVAIATLKNKKKYSDILTVSNTEEKK